MHSLDDLTDNTTRKQFWRQHVNGWRDSGLSKRQYCQQYDLVYHQMIYWCAKSEVSDEAINTGAGGFAQVALPNVVASHSPSLSIELPSGVTINNLTPQTIAFLPALLQSL